MFNILFLILSVIAGIGLGIIYCLLVIKKYPEKKRKSGFAAAIFVFLLISLALYSQLSMRAFSIKFISEKAAGIEKHIIQNNPNNKLVKNGIDLNIINNDLSKMNAAAAEFGKLLPDHTELGIPQFAHEFLLSFAVGNVQKHISKVNNTAKIVNAYADNNGVLTASSLIHGIENRIIRIIHISTIISCSVLLFLLLIYIIVTLNRAFKAKNQ